MSFLDAQIKPAVFREYDIRGVVGRDLNADFAELLGLGYGRFIEGKQPVAGRKTFTIAVGRDCRLTSDEYADGLIRGLRLAGLDVIFIGVCPTPVAYFSLYHYDLDGAIMITGSHNARDYNGFKIAVGRDTLHGEQIQELRKNMEAVLQVGAGLPVAREGSFSEKEIIPFYIDHLLKIAQPLRKKKIVLDSGNGTAASVAPELFKLLGADVISLFGVLDGNFPNHHPDPTVSKNLRDLVATVKKEKADFGVAFDGDSDRIGVVDETGKILYGDELMVLFSRDILRENPGATIVSDVKCSHRLYEDISSRGGRPIMWKAGHSVIRSKMKLEKALLAGEMSGHIFFSDRYFGFDDAIYAALRVYEIASRAEAPFSSLLADLPVSISTPEIRVECSEEKKFALVEAAKREMKKLPHSINDIDGVRVDFGDGWGLIRASNTQPALVLRFEASNPARMEEIRLVFELVLKNAAEQVGHPIIDTRPNT